MTRNSFSLATPKALAMQRGQSSIEYTIVCAALALALGVGIIDDTSVLHQLIDAFQTAYQRFSYALSLPI
ncbi:MAG TPA: hypothetical protein VJ654_04700 [Noviherbaspirillum sp.]|nr:hypothetical protein [Noviherbaspirillum sp.]